MPRFACLALAAALLVVGSGCVGDDTQGAQPAATTPVGPGQGGPGDVADGRHAVYLLGLDVGRSTLTFDVVRWLTGAAAVAAYQAHNPGETGGPPNDYFVANDEVERQTLPVAEDVVVALVRLDEDSDADLDPGSWLELPGYLAGGRPADGRLSWSPFWITVEAGIVVGIEEQYIP